MCDILQLATPRNCPMDNTCNSAPQLINKSSFFLFSLKKKKKQTNKKKQKKKKKKKKKNKNKNKNKKKNKTKTIIMLSDALFWFTYFSFA